MQKEYFAVEDSTALDPMQLQEQVVALHQKPWQGLSRIECHQHMNIEVVIGWKHVLSTDLR